MILKDGTEWPLNTAYNGDCLSFMKNLPDKCIDLVLTDPPYGIGADTEQGLGDKRTGNRKKSKWVGGVWDNEIPNDKYFKEIFRVSKHQIIWGGNYFNLQPNRCFLIWDKVQRIDQADCELAWTSFNTSARIFTYARGNMQGFRNPDRFHPTEKPLHLFKWCLEKYAPENAIVFDPFLGSFTTAVACHNYGLNWIGCEKDEDYFKAGLNRYNMEKEQMLMDFN